MSPPTPRVRSVQRPLDRRDLRLEALVIDAAYRRQFANNQNAAFKAWETKVTTAQKEEDEAKRTAAIERITFIGNKVQFMLDATLGMINIDQNNILKIMLQ